MELGAVDADGTTRHIVRSVEPVATYQGPREEKDWRWVLETLCRALRRQGAAASEDGRALAGIPIPETVLFENGVPSFWVFETLDGTLALRPSSLCVLDAVKARFRTGAGDNSPHRIATALTEAGTRRVLSYEGLANLRQSDKTVSLQLYITPKTAPAMKGALAGYLHEELSPVAQDEGDAPSFRHEFILQPDGRPRMHSFRLGAPIAFDAKGRPQREAIRSRNATINAQMDAASQALVRALEAVSRFRVISISSEYLMDINDRLWLAGTRTVVVTEDRSGDRPGSGMGAAFEPTPTDFQPPSHFAQRRAAAAEATKDGAPTASEEDLVLRDLGLDGTADITDIADMALLRTGKHKAAMTSRELRRSQAVEVKFKPRVILTSQEAAAAEDLDSGNEGSNKTAGPSASTALKPEGTSRFLASALAGFDRNDFAKAVSNSLELTHAKGLASSQNSACPGDFCDISLDLATGKQEGPQAQLSLRPLREGRFADTFNATEGDLGAAFRDDGDAKPGLESAGGLAHDPSKTVSFRGIVQARMERKLVELLIKRILKGEKGDYVQSVADLESSQLGLSFPNHYYEPVRVCANCFKLYSTIENARNRAIDKLDPKHAQVRARLEQRQRVQLALEKDQLAAQDLTAGARQGDYRVNPFSEEGKRLMQLSFDELQALATKRARQAVQALNKSSLAELRAFQSPPLAVHQVAHALMLLLTGKATSWEATKAIMASGARLTAMLLDFDMDCIPPQRIADLESFVKDPSFRPSVIAATNKAAAVLCEFVLGAVMAHKYKAGAAHPRSDPLLFIPADATARALAAQDGTAAGDPAVPTTGAHASGAICGGGLASNSSNKRPRNACAQTGDVGAESRMVQVPSYLLDAMELHADLEALQHPDADVAPLQDKLDQQRKRQRQRKGGRPRLRYAKSPRPGEAEADAALFDGPRLELALPNIDPREYQQGPSKEPLLSPTALSYAQHKALAGSVVGLNRHASSDQSLRSRMIQTTSQPSIAGTRTENGSSYKDALGALRAHVEGLEASTASQQPSKRELRARRKFQEKQMQRLHAGGQDALIATASSGAGDETSAKTVSSQSFVCSDGKTTLTYEVVGTGGLESSTPNLIVLHDIFDTCEASQIFLEPLLRKHYGSQALVLNYPGQAHTRFPVETAGVLNNEFMAATLHELLAELERRGDFCCSIRPFYLLGVGNGANIAAFFASEFGGLPEYRKCLRGLLSINGYAHVDEQLAAVLHSSVNIFESFPATRPDLPISYFSRFLFSDDYLKRVDPALVLNIYTAVGNPITLQGRSHLCQGALRHKDVRKQLRELRVPVVVIQSTENALVNPTNVDPFIEGRMVSHLWSHQFLDSGKIGPKAVDQLRAAMCRADGAFVVWLKAGHEVRQESKAQILDIVDNLLASSAEMSGDLGDFAAGLQPSKRAKEASQAMVARRALPQKTAAPAKRQAKKRDLAPSVGDREEIMFADVEECKREFLDEVADFDPADCCHQQARRTQARKQQQLGPKNREVCGNGRPGGNGNGNGGARPAAASIEDAAQCEFEEAMRKHRETKRLAEEARQARLADLEAMAAQEEERFRQERELAERARAQAEAEARAALEAELDERRRRHEEELHNVLEEKQRAMMAEVEAERDRAKALTESLEQQLAYERACSEESRHTVVDADIGAPEDAPAPCQGPEVVQTVANQVQCHGVQPITGGDPAVDPGVQRQETVADVQLEVQRQIEHLRREQEKRRRQWELEDQRRIQELERQLLGRQTALALTGAALRASSGADEIRMVPRDEVAASSTSPEPEGQARCATPSGAPDPCAASAAGPTAGPAPRSWAEGDDDGDLGHVGDGDLGHGDLGHGDLGRGEQDDGRGDLGARARAAVAVAEGEVGGGAEGSTLKTIEAAIASAEASKPAVERVGVLGADAYAEVQREMEAAEEERRRRESAARGDKVKDVRNEMAVEIQRLYRGRLARARTARLRQDRMAQDDRFQAAVRLQALQRGRLGRERAAEARVLALRDREEAQAVVAIQRVGRGMLGRGRARVQRQERAATVIESACRRYLATKAVSRARGERARIIREGVSATKIQSVWRMWRGREEFLHQRILDLAALQIQRVYRGVRGRRRAHRKRTWENAEPGPERLELGLGLIEDSKAAFSAQQEEIDALHRAQERAETRVSQVHAGLEESERELAVLEQELRDVDQLDETLHELTHEKALFDARADIAEREARARKGSAYDPSTDEDARKRAAEAYALEMQIHIKRAERERKKKELEAEFAAVFQEVEAKKSELRALELSLHDMESTRKRKEREFQRLQRNLMELLEEQKAELDNLRERGIELESATATSAAAAAATATAAKENEERSKQMFASTEELLKFQFMSMSLSYFSSINMLKNLRDINSDTTQQAISSSADTAAAAAAAAEAANIESVAALKVGAGDVPQSKLREKAAQLKRQKEAESAANLLKEPFPQDVRLWTVQDVARWLDTLSLGQYKGAFAEACIDGDFLMELRVEDMRDILGMRHALHVQKVDLARNKLRPLSEQETRQKQAVEWETKVAESRMQGGAQEGGASEDVPEVDSVFSQIRNGRFNRVERALDMGFDPNETDSHGNTALIVAAQNLNKRIAELLIRRGANVNHQNSQGNTAMHFAFSYDMAQESGLGELLISHGADDSIENRLGLSCYDGIE